MIRVAIDGPAGAGKSSVAREVAKRLGFVYIDTGAMYRACAVYAIENNIKISAETINESVLDKIKMDIVYDENGQKIFLCGSNVSERIREADATIGASDISAIPAVRKKMTSLQKSMVETGNVIMDGRDIGTCVIPDAEVKIFLTASVSERANRRYRELLQKGIEADYDQVKKDIEYRDKNDAEREISPLKMADDAILLDTTDITAEQAVEKLISIINGEM